ncbi:MAG: hypothetical protein FWE06_03480 [Oscillospiraceae bacterium]|nr:hypothetical protein [Oscillospiraceae bacterium]
MGLLEVIVLFSSAITSAVVAGIVAHLANRNAREDNRWLTALIDIAQTLLSALTILEDSKPLSDENYTTLRDKLVLLDIYGNSEQRISAKIALKSIAAKQKPDYCELNKLVESLVYTTRSYIYPNESTHKPKHK